MRKQWIGLAAAVIGVSMGAFGVAAQGPQGAGAGGGKQSSEASHSYNPVKWIKKDSNKADEAPKKAKATKTSAKQATNSKATKSSAKQQAANDDPTPRARRSFNPIRWIKKDSNKAGQNPKKAKATKSSTKQAMNDDPTPRARRSYNPIKWIKKDRNDVTKKPQKANDKKPSAKPVTLEAPARPAVV